MKYSSVEAQNVFCLELWRPRAEYAREPNGLRLGLYFSKMYVNAIPQDMQ